MRKPAQCDHLVYFSTALTYLRSKVTHLNIGIGGIERGREERKGRGRIIKALSGWAQLELNPLFWEKKRRRWRMKETRRKQDKGIKEHSIISWGTDQAEEAKQTEVACSVSRIIWLQHILAPSSAFYLHWRFLVAPNISRLPTVSEVWSIVFPFLGGNVEFSRWRLCVPVYWTKHFGLFIKVSSAGCLFFLLTSRSIEILILLLC